MRGDYVSVLQTTRRRTFDNHMRSLVDKVALVLCYAKHTTLVSPF